MTPAHTKGGDCNHLGLASSCRVRIDRWFRGALITLIFTVFSNAHAAWRLPSSIKIQQAPEVIIEVDPNVVIRNNVPPALFGFNMPWINFQRGYWRNQQVRPEIIAWLKPFKGATYRYPGGDISNWFEWHKAVGPRASRGKQHTNFNNYANAEFGLDEYLDFVKAVNGLPLLTLNLKGTKQETWDDKAALKSNLDWMQYVINREGKVGTGNLTYCQPVIKCPVKWWELGNELDLGDDAWTSERYVSRSKIVGTRMLSLDPQIELIAQMTTSPWGKGRRPNASAFNNTVGAGLSHIVKGYAYHSYYDGVSIPEINQHLENAVNNLIPHSRGLPPSIFVTEHARWPEKPVFGEWQKNWAQTGDLGGAISTADYLLSQMALPNVHAMMWHELGAWGPWQLFYVDPTDKAYPNVVYWGMRVLRDGFLDDSLQINVTSSNISAYKGGYDVRAVFMQDDTRSRYSLMAVNRANAEIKAKIRVKGFRGKNFAVTRAYITGRSSQESNTNEAPNKVVLKTDSSTLKFDSNDTAIITFLPNSVSAYVLQPIS